MSIDYDDLAEWFSERPAWLQDAARRLFQTGDLTEADLAELLILCKREAGIAVAERPELSATSVPASALNVAGANVPLRLDALTDVKGINALAPRGSLCFSSQHLTVIFGLNGSGKSGYIRILKHVCGGRGTRALHRNVFDSTHVDPSCTIGYTHDGAEKLLRWRPTDGAHADLRSISLFDSDCANVYVNEENQVAYEPTLLCYFRRLVEACDQVNAVLGNEADSKTSAKPELPKELGLSAGGRWYAALTDETTTAMVDQHCAWDSGLDAELESLLQRIAEQNPAEKAKAIRNVKSRVNELLTELQEWERLVGDDALTKLLAARADAATKRRAADDAAKRAFGRAPLSGVASESWQLLWEKARLYSASMAYPGKTFPVVEAGARCVLCQQALGKDAAARLVEFETFVTGSLESDAKAAEAMLASLLATATDVALGTTLEAKLDIAAISDESLRAAVRERSEELKMRRDAVLMATQINDVRPLPETRVYQSLMDVAAKHEAAAAVWDEDATQNNKSELAERARDLRARKWLSEQKAAVLTETARLKEVAQVVAAQRLTNTLALSTKKTTLSDLLITAAFIARFEYELKELGASHLRVTIEKTRTTKGQVWHRIALKDNTLPVMTAEVLSEGELRVVAIAAFLADVAINQDNSPLIFDDPISSLDQDYEEAIAYRLAKMSLHRQVVIFTHRLSLLHLVEEVCKKEAATCAIVSLHRQPWGAGDPGAPPLPAQKPAQALKSLAGERLARAKKVWSNEGAGPYQVEAKALCSDLRITIERLIEYDLLADVVQRFRRPIKTMGIIGKLARISAEDCKFLDEVMTKYSRYEHAQPDEAPVRLPEPHELEADLNRLMTWLRDFSARPVPAAG